MKKIIIVLMGIIVLIIVGTIFLSNVKMPQSPSGGGIVHNTDNVLNHSNGRFCYAYHNKATKDAPYSVDEYIDMNINGAVATGTKKGNQSGPDMTNGYQGTLTGSIDKDNLTAIFAYVVEGSHNSEKELYRFTKNGLEKLRYPLINDKGMLVPDTTKAFNIITYDKFNCEENYEPIALSTKYITSVNPWPPKVTFTNGNFTCNETGSEINQNGITARKIIRGKEYCVTTQSEGAAGSTYTTYTYTTSIGSKLASTSFVLRFPQCMNYDDPKQTECKNERSSFNSDILADSIITKASVK
jgi:hypothetical protein